MNSLFYALTLMAFTVVAVFLLRSIYLRTRELNRRIKEFKAEMAERQKQGIPFNPYLELSQLYEEAEQAKTKGKRQKR